ncbi:bifunctional hydroxymethylpyrimidine kinase/phosphomethylpyrimidine kinase [Sediminispirochaeta bajacaliforniensis]|uniref:bifunctional hydroxymethylpyrimidine kinase/phosphomethylpyrimidine kinase n=1 Tax=Sediminispirochaeta bajacaliforniensis TaxID=148 RepID=UPI0003798D3F|nr:bifunctional hydroxymethylpyrimidine kinase/phosphomethylpyrimidine kinase [Sediminispirochaeta bajacaliforniensis]
MKHLLSIAGSDCSGGAGIQADLKAFSANGVYGMTVITAITAQNTRGVRAVRAMDPDIVTAQIDAVFSDIRVDGVKIGMLAEGPIIEAVAAALRRWKPPITVLDPVMVAKSGHRLLTEEAERLLTEELLPLADLITPNIPEALKLAYAGQTQTQAEGAEQNENLSEQERERLALEILKRGARAVLIKGGHADDPDRSVDLLADGKGFRRFEAGRLDAHHTHGTGCSLSSALAAFLARGFSLEAAVERAKAYVTEGIAHGIAIGGGCGPIHHFYALYGGEELQP